MTDVLYSEGTAITVKRSRRKSMALHVRDGRVELRVPHGLPRHTLDQFVRSRQTWLDRVLSDQAQQQAQRPDYTRAETCPLLDEQLRLVRHTGARSGWRRRGDELHLTLPTFTRDSTHSLLADFYKSEARDRLERKTRAHLQSLGWLDRLLDVRIRRTKSKWGHCTAQGRIQYNWLVMQAPERVVDYLVVHECAHLEHPHHGPAFWAAVEARHPGWREDRRWLHDNGHRLWL